MSRMHLPIRVTLSAVSLCFAFYSHASSCNSTLDIEKASLGTFTSSVEKVGIVVQGDVVHLPLTAIFAHCVQNNDQFYFTARKPYESFEYRLIKFDLSNQLSFGTVIHTPLDVRLKLYSEESKKVLNDYVFSKDAEGNTIQIDSVLNGTHTRSVYTEKITLNIPIQDVLTVDKWAALKRGLPVVGSFYYFLLKTIRSVEKGNERYFDIGEMDFPEQFIFLRFTPDTDNRNVPKTELVMP